MKRNEEEVNTPAGTIKIPRVDALKSSCLPLFQIREENRKIIKDLLTSVGSPKILVLDKSLAGPLGLLVESSELKLWGTQAWYVLGNYDIDPTDVIASLEPPSTGVLQPLHMIFLTRSDTELMGYIARQIKKGKSEIYPRRYIIGFVPRQTEEAMSLLYEHLGSDSDNLLIKRDIQICRCPIYFYPFDSDIVSLELPSVFRKFHAHSDPTSLVTCSEAIMQLQSLLGGLLPRIWAVGNASKFICDQLLRYRRELQMQLPKSFLSNNQRNGSTSDSEMNSLSLKNIGPSELLPVPTFHYFVPLNDEMNPIHGSTFNNQKKNDSLNSPQNKDTSFDNNEDDDDILCEEGLPNISEYKPPAPFDKYHDYIDDLLLIDRRVDLVTPFSTPFTYEALLDLLIGIRHSKNTQLKFRQVLSIFFINPSFLQAYLTPPETNDNITNDSSSKGDSKNRVSLNSADSIFSEIRNLPQSRVGGILHEKAASIQQTYQEKQKLQSISEINQFMKRFKIKQQEHTSVAFHVDQLTYISNILKTEDFQNLLKLEDDIMSAASNTTLSSSIWQNIFSNIEDLADSSEGSPNEVYRLMCLASVMGNGIKPKFLDMMYKALTQMFGIQELHRLHLLDSCGLILPHQNGKNRWPEIKSTLELIQDDSAAGTTTAVTEDMSYVCAGYAPLSARLVEYLYRKVGGWRSFSKLFDILWGPTLEARQRLLCEGSNKNTDQKLEEEKKTLELPVTIVFYVGGCTYAEIAAIRHLAKLETGKRRFIIFTTEIINFKSFIDSFTPLCV